jgi:hypothetical protein
MRLLVGIARIACIAVAGCGGGNAASQLARPPDFDPPNQTKCGVVKSQARPLVIEWPSPDRMALEGKLRQGLAVVRYEGCEMELLPRCSVPARYGYVPATWSEDRVVIRNHDDLYANLPVGAARLESRLDRGGALTVEMDLVGSYVAQRAEVRTEELQGECAGATHFVYGATVGAFQFYADADAQVGGNAGIGPFGGGASSNAYRETLTRNGDEAACRKAMGNDAMPPPQCGAIVRIEVVKIASSVPASCPYGTVLAGGRCEPLQTPVVPTPRFVPPPPTPSALEAPPSAITLEARNANLEESWSLTNFGGGVVCTLPCRAEILPDNHYDLVLDGPRRARVPFMRGPEDAGKTVHVSVDGPRGSAGTAVLVGLAGLVTAGVGAYFYTVGNTQKCGFGPQTTTDSSGNASTTYKFEQSGTCNSVTPPTGYQRSDGADLGNTANGNQQLGTGLLIGGGAVTLLSTIWFLWSRDGGALDWSPAGRSIGSVRAAPFWQAGSPGEVRGTFRF